MLFLLIASLLFAAEASPARYWHRVHEEPAAGSEDFRGCFEEDFCLVVRTEERGSLYRHHEGETAWLVGTGVGEPQLIFSEEKPGDAQWARRLPSEAVVPGAFDATKYDGKEKKEVIEKFLEKVKVNQMMKTVEELSEFHTRNSLSAEAQEAALFILKKVGPRANCSLSTFRSGYSQNILCAVRGSKHPETVVIGAHYDDRSTSVKDPKQRAPGADDNGSGTAAVLEILDVIHPEYEFEKTIIFAFFSGEEQGLYGSESMAKALARSAEYKVEAMINMDMIGYPEKNQEHVVWWMSRATTKTLTDLAIELTKTYLGEDQVVKTTTGCCSDQSSFYDQGIAAASIFEALTGTNNPCYHRECDKPSTIHQGHYEKNAHAAAALLATIGELSKK